MWLKSRTTSTKSVRSCPFTSLFPPFPAVDVGNPVPPFLRGVCRYQHWNYVPLQRGLCGPQKHIGTPFIDTEDGPAIQPLLRTMTLSGLDPGIEVWRVTFREDWNAVDS